MHSITGFEVRLARRFKLGLDGAQSCQNLLQLGIDPGRLMRQPGAFGERLVAPNPPERVLALLAQGLEGTVFARDFRLPLELVHLPAQRKTRSSSGRASMMRDTVPWPIMAYARGPRPVPRNRSWTSLRRTLWLLIR